MSNLTTLPKGDSAWLLRKSIQRIIQQVSVLETNIGSSTTGNSSNTQIIFNDAGTLRGDSGLTYNKTTDVLSVGAATITGDLTVRTNKLAVTSTGVGIGTTSPNPNFQVTLNGLYGLRIQTADTNNSVANIGCDPASGYAFFDVTKTGTGTFLPLRFSTSDTERYRIATDGVATWSNVGGVAGTAMTLNATGLGVGLSPVSGEKLSVNGSVFINAGNALKLCNASVDYVSQILNTAGSGQGNFAFVLGASTPMLLDSSGNLGIGVTPSAWSGFKALQVQYACLASNRFGAGNIQTFIGSNTFYDGIGYKYIVSDTAARYALNDNVHAWYTASSGTAGTTITDFATAKMTLDADGNLYLKTTSRLSSGVFSVAYVPGTSQGAVFQPSTDVSSPTPILFLNSSGSAVGSITTTASATAYNISSDYRLKEAVQPLVGCLARISALKPSIYKWKADGSNGEGFLAHELAEVVPLAVTGEKDAVNEDGSIKAQGVDLSKVVPVLVAAIQELTARVQTLETR